MKHYESHLKLKTYYFVGNADDFSIKIELISHITKTLLFKKVNLNGTKLSISQYLTKHQQEERKFWLNIKERETEFKSQKLQPRTIYKRYTS